MNGNQFAVVVEPVEGDVHLLEIFFGNRSFKAKRGRVHAAIAVAVIEAVLVVVHINAACVLHRDFLVVLVGRHAVCSREDSIGATGLIANGFDLEHIAHSNLAGFNGKCPLVTLLGESRHIERIAIELQALTACPRRVHVLVEANNQGIGIAVTLHESSRLNSGANAVGQRGLLPFAMTADSRADISLHGTRCRISLQFHIHIGKSKDVFFTLDITAVLLEIIVARPAVVERIHISRFNLTAEPGCDAIANAITIGIINGGVIESRHIGVRELVFTRERICQNELGATHRILTVIKGVHAEVRTIGHGLGCHHLELALAVVNI